ncbi:ABC transporter permease [Bosea beijingensis]
MHPFSTLFTYRHVLLVTSINEIRGRYMGTILGIAWTIAYPFMFLGLYASVYGAILGVRVANMTPYDYILLVFSGLIPFIGFSEALTTTTGSVVANKQLLKNTLFPIELLPVKAVLASSVSMTVGFIGLLLALWMHGRIGFSQIMLLYVMALQLIFSVGLGWILASLNVFFRDISQIIGIAVLFLMIISPIGYTADMIPAKLKFLAYGNPLYYIIELYRQALFGGISLPLLLGFTLVSLLSFVLGHRLFMRLKPVFSEYV